MAKKIIAALLALTMLFGSGMAAYAAAPPAPDAPQAGAQADPDSPGTQAEDEGGPEEEDGAPGEPDADAPGENEGTDEPGEAPQDTPGDDDELPASGPADDGDENEADDEEDAAGTMRFAAPTSGSLAQPKAVHPATHDTFVHDSAANSAVAMGGKSYLEVKEAGAGWSRRALLKFDTAALEPEEGDRVMLRLYISKLDCGGYWQNETIDLSVFATNYTGWSEDTLSYANKSADFGMPAMGDGDRNDRIKVTYPAEYATKLGDITIATPGTRYAEPYGWVELDISDYLAANSPDVLSLCLILQVNNQVMLNLATKEADPALAAQLAVVGTSGPQLPPEVLAGYAQVRQNWFNRLTGAHLYEDGAVSDYAAGVADATAIAQEYWAQMLKNAGREQLWDDLYTPLPGSGGAPTDPGAGSRQLRLLSSAERGALSGSALANSSYSAGIADSYQRLQAMAVAWASQGGALYHSDALKADILDGLLWLNGRVYNPTVNPSKQLFGNWYHWSITTPQAILDIAVLMYGELDQAQVNDIYSAVNTFCNENDVHSTGSKKPYPFYIRHVNGSSRNSMTSSNLGLTSAISLLKEAVGQQGAGIALALEGFSEILVYAGQPGADGIYPDGSLLQHSGLAYNGGYGISLIRSSEMICTALYSTPWAPTGDISILFNTIEKGFLPLMANGAMMDMTTGRGIAREGHGDVQTARGFIQPLSALLAYAGGGQKSTLQAAVKSIAVQGSAYYSSQNADYYSGMRLPERLAILGIVKNSDIPAQMPTGYTKVYGSMDKAVVHRNGFSLGISMYSSRTGSFEFGNGENLRGWNMSDGALYLYVGDQAQYADSYWPTVDPHRLAGITTDGSEGAVPSSWSIHKSSKDYAGGAVLSDYYASVGMHLEIEDKNRSSNLTQAYKSWFVFGDAVVAVGSDIRFHDRGTVETIVENRKVDGNALYVDGTPAAQAPGAAQSLPGAQWAWLQGSAGGSPVGYYFPGGSDIQVLREDVTGSWKLVNSNGSATPITRQYVSIAVDHTAQQVPGYSYVLLPGYTQEQTRSFAQNAPITVLSGGDGIHAVSDSASGVTGYSFFVPGRVGVVAAASPAAVTMQDNNDGTFTLAVADPTHKNAVTALTLCDYEWELVSADAGVTAGENGGYLMLSVPTGGSAGASFTATVRRGAEKPGGSGSFLSIEQGDLSLAVGNKRFLSYSDPEEAPGGVAVWHSGDEAVATVAANGLLTALRPGTAAITLTSADGKRSDSITVTVGPNTTPPDFASMRRRWLQRILGSDSVDADDAHIAAYRTRLIADAAAVWGSLDTGDTRGLLWPDPKAGSSVNNDRSAHYTTQFKNIRTLAQAFATEGGPLYSDPTAFRTILDCLEFMTDDLQYNGKFPKIGNWWDWQIGCTQPFVDTLMILQDYMEPAIVARYVSYINGYAYDPSRQINISGGSSTATTANRTDIGLAVLGQGILIQDAARVGLVIEKVAPALAVKPFSKSGAYYGDGMYPDGSFIDHSFIAYTGSYGNEFIKGVGRIMNVVAGTAHDFEQAELDGFYDYVLEAFLPLLYNGKMMSMVSGRAVSRVQPGGAEQSAGNGTMSNLMVLAKNAPDKFRAAVQNAVKYQVNASRGFFDHYARARDIEALCNYKEIMTDASIPGTLPFSGVKIYGGMDRVVQVNGGYGVGIALSSARIAGYESINHENLKGWHSGSGMLYVYNSDFEQFGYNFWPTVDPYRLPGTTVNTAPLADAKGSATRPGNNWAGGATDGTHAAVGYAYSGSHVGHNTMAYKSYFLLDGAIVQLGSNIWATTSSTVETVVDNRMLNKDGSNRVLINGQNYDGTAQSLALPANSWIHLQGSVDGADMGYFFPQAVTLEIKREKRTGNYTGINAGQINTADIEQYYLTMCINHGTGLISGVDYGYLTLPGITAVQLDAFAQSSGIEVLENSASAHAVRDLTAGLELACNFWGTGSYAVQGVTLSASASVLLTCRDGVYTLTIAEPKHNVNALTVRLDTEMHEVLGKDDAITVGEDNRTLTVNTKNAGGGSFQISFTRKVPLQSIHLSENTLSLAEGESGTLVAGFAPANHTGSKEITWASSDEAVATVDDAGRVTAVSKGTAVITATSPEDGVEAASCTVTVTRPLAGISAEKAGLELTVGGTGTVKILLSPADTTDAPTIVWSSGSPSVATVDASGKITAVAPGTAVITAKAGGYTAQITVTVKAAPTGNENGGSTSGGDSSGGGSSTSGSSTGNNSGSTGNGGGSGTGGAGSSGGQGGSTSSSGSGSSGSSSSGTSAPDGASSTPSSGGDSASSQPSASDEGDISAPTAGPGSQGSLLWLWILLAVVLLGGAVSAVLILRRRRRE